MRVFLETFLRNYYFLVNVKFQRYILSNNEYFSNHLQHEIKLLVIRPNKLLGY